MSENNSIYVKPVQVPEGTKIPGNLQSLINVVTNYMEIVGVENYSQILVGATPPSPDQEDAIWLEVDGTGEPQALKVWDGAGWRVLEFRIPFGSTDARPPLPKEGEKYYDTTITQELIYLNGLWRTSWGGPGQRIFVGAESVEEAERKFPGWLRDEDAQGMMIRGASNDVPSGTTGGVSETKLTIEHMPEHHHESAPIPDSEALNPYLFGSGEKTGAAIVDTKDQQNSKAGKTSSTGEGKSFSILNPYYAIWVLKRL